MNKRWASVLGLAALATVGMARGEALAQAAIMPQVEYIDIRWDGVDRMCVVYPDGKVEFLGTELKAYPRPDEANKRAFYMTIAMNRMVARGYELAGFISDEIIMKRTVR